jgi:MtN3 and saliva related transmembrane protein
MKEFVALVFGLGLIGNAFLFVPQALAVWRKKSDEGVSLVTFGGFCILQVLGVIHGVYQHDRSLIVGLGASFLTCVCAPQPAARHEPGQQEKFPYDSRIQIEIYCCSLAGLAV